MPVDSPVARLYALAVAEEVASELRHEAVNGFGGLSAMAYQLWRRVTTAHPSVTQDDAIVGIYKGFSTHVAAAAERLEVRFLPPAPSSTVPIDVATVLREVVAAAGVDGKVTIATGAPRVRIDSVEFAAMLFGMLDSLGTPAHVGLGFDDAAVIATVAPLPGSADAPSPLGFRVAQRFAARWRGELNLLIRDDGKLAAELRLPREERSV